MFAFLPNDKWYTADNRAFGGNTDGVDRKEIDPEEARQAFSFDIEKYPSFTETGVQIPKHFHLRRSDDDAIVPSRGVGDEYTPIQHIGVYDYLVNEIMPQIPDMKLEAVGTMHGGGTGIVSATLGGNYSLPGDKSPHRTRLFFCNPTNGKGSLVLGETTVRLFCQNQIAAASRQAGKNGIRVYHTKNAEVRVEHAKDAIYDQLQAVYALKQREEALARVSVDSSDLARVLNRLFPLNRFEEGSRGHTRMLNQREEVITQFESGETAQSFTDKSGLCLFNAITYPVFNPRTIGKETDLAQIRFSGTMGSRAARVRNILTVVEQELDAVA